MNSPALLPPVLSFCALTKVSVTKALEVMPRVFARTSGTASSRLPRRSGVGGGDLGA